MPASLLADMNTHSGVGLEDQRALQIALELTKLGLDDNDNAPGPSAAALSTYTANMTSNERKSANMTECVPVPSSEHVAEIVGRQGCKIKALRAKTNTYIKTPVRGEEPVFLVTGRREDVEAAKREILSAAEHFSQIRASRRNNNPSGPSGSLPGPPTPNTPGQVTIQVRVPYRVVGLVVGPKGATIKRIQQQTRTYIVTPNRDKEPIFEVTGLPDNVDKARQEIESHIAMRTGGMLDSAANMNGGGVVGVLGPVLGGNMNGHDEHRHNDFHTNGIDAGFHEISNDLLNSIYKPPSTNSAFTSYTSALNQSNNVLSQQQQQQQQRHRHGGQDNIFTFPPLTNGVTKLAEMTGLTNGFNTPPSFGLYDSDEGIGGSPSFDHNPIPMPNASIWSEITNGDHCITESGSFTNMFAPISGSGGLSKRSNSSVNVCTVSSASLSPPLTADSTLSSSSSSIATTLSSDHSSVRRICSDPLSSGGAITGTGEMMMTTTAACYHPSSAHALVTSTSLGSAHSLRSSSSSSPTDSTGSLGRRRHCMVCGDNDIVAALVPCGHNLFCMECANLIFDKPVCQRHCPVCQQAPTQAIRIFS